MPASTTSYRWVLAVSTAVLFPALILHTTCVAVMGPGTWGSGVVEALPDFREPTAIVEQYRKEFLSATTEADPSARRTPPPPDGSGILGEIRWAHHSADRAVYLTEDVRGATRTSRIYVAGNGRYREIPVPPEHVVARPQWVGDRIVYERWNPWALPPVAKLQRYVSGFADPSLRPEASLYGSDSEVREWYYLMPGHSLKVAPGGRRAALLRSGALLAGYYSIHVWDTRSEDTSVVVSLREHAGNAAKSFSLSWSADSNALRIAGSTDGFDRRSPRAQDGRGGVDLDLLYLVPEGTVYDLGLSR